MLGSWFLRSRGSGRESDTQRAEEEQSRDGELHAATLRCTYGFACRGHAPNHHNGGQNHNQVWHGGFYSLAHSTDVPFIERRPAVPS
jgi:hypothetical protein